MSQYAEAAANQNMLDMQEMEAKFEKRIAVLENEIEMLKSVFNLIAHPLPKTTNKR